MTWLLTLLGFVTFTVWMIKLLIAGVRRFDDRPVEMSPSCSILRRADRTPPRQLAEMTALSPREQLGAIVRKLGPEDLA